MPKLVLRKQENETWLECIERYAAPYGLQLEVIKEFKRNILAGIDEAEAAWDACYEWDILDVE